MTFWQVTTDMALAMEPGPGFGHNFAGEHVGAWAQVLDLDNWTTQRAAAVHEAVLAESRAPFTPSQ